MSEFNHFVQGRQWFFQNLLPPDRNLLLICQFRLISWLLRAKTKQE